MHFPHTFFSFAPGLYVNCKIGASPPATPFREAANWTSPALAEKECCGVSKGVIRHYFPIGDKPDITRFLHAAAFELSVRRPFRSSLGEETGVEVEDSGMLLNAACGKQDRGDNGASMPETKRGSGLGDRSHGGEIAERR